MVIFEVDQGVTGVSSLKDEPMVDFLYFLDPIDIDGDSRFVLSGRLSIMSFRFS